MSYSEKEKGTIVYPYRSSRIPPEGNFGPEGFGWEVVIHLESYSEVSGIGLGDEFGVIRESQVHSGLKQESPTLWSLAEAVRVAVDQRQLLNEELAGEDVNFEIKIVPVSRKEAIATQSIPVRD